METTNYLSCPEYTDPTGRRSVRRLSFRVRADGRVMVHDWIEYVANGKPCAGGDSPVAMSAEKARGLWRFAVATLGAKRVESDRHAYAA